MSPYLSIVMGIGGNLTRDLQIRLGESLLNIQRLERSTAASIEAIVVEWNTPDTKLQLMDCVFPVRVIHAGHVHATYPNPNKLAYFEMAPKNIGIRRARGEFVLSCNPDDLFSEEMFGFFRQRLLQHGHFYRAHRHDTKEGKVYRICYETGCFEPGKPHDKPLPRASPLGGLHYNASGDFVLMAKDDWFAIHGNPERDYNHTVDGQTVWLAHTKGLKQIILPYPFYHPDHKRTLNINADGNVIGPAWDDNKPFTQENGDGWGCAGMEFEETIL